MVIEDYSDGKRGSQLMSIDVLFNADPIDYRAEGLPKSLGLARLAFDKKGRCIKDNHTNIIGRQLEVDILLRDCKEMIAGLDNAVNKESLLKRIDEALS